MQINRVSFSKQAIEMFQSEIDIFGNIETGGVMLGYVTDETIYVEKVSNGGSKAIHDYLYFKADNNYIEMFIDMEIANFGGKLRYLGEWHTHPERNPNPSVLDLDSLEEIAESTGDFCLFVILGSIEYKRSLFLDQSIAILKEKDIDTFYEIDKSTNTV